MKSSLNEHQKGSSVAQHPPMLTWDKFLSVLAENKDHPFKLEAFVKINQNLLMVTKSTHDQAIGIANVVKEVTKYQFKYI